MDRLIVFGGTTEGRELCQKCLEQLNNVVIICFCCYRARQGKYCQKEVSYTTVKQVKKKLLQKPLLIIYFSKSLDNLTLDKVQAFTIFSVTSVA